MVNAVKLVIIIIATIIIKKCISIFYAEVERRTINL